jgi:two-component system sensor histidine kinase BaeS
VSGAPRGRSLVWTVAGVFVLATILATVVQILIASQVLRPFEAREARARAELAATSLARELESTSGRLSDADVDSLLAHRRLALGVRPAWIMYQQLDGHVAGAPSTRTEWVAPLLPRLGRPAVLRDPPANSDGPRRLELLARAVVRRDGKALGQLFVLQPTRPNDLIGVLTAPPTLMTVPVSILLSAFVGLFLVRLLVVRLRAMGTLAARVAEGDLTVRINDIRGDEIGLIAGQLDLMTERLARARDLIEATEQQRRQLFADITHELATPLTSIRAHAETLLDPAVPLEPAERTRYVQGVLEESRRLDRLIRDLFELARLEAGASPLVIERLDWVALCRNTTDRFDARFKRAGLTLAWRESVAEAWIEADGHRMEQVLENLLGNALHYVPSGGHVELALTLQPGHTPRFRLEVGDDGPGIAEAELPRLFERFYRAAEARGGGAAHELGGSGLGLAIVREIVARHGGRVQALARRPSGLGIRVELPATN